MDELEFVADAVVAENLVERSDIAEGHRVGIEHVRLAFRHARLFESRFAEPVGHGPRL